MASQQSERLGQPRGVGWVVRLTATCTFGLLVSACDIPTEPPSFTFSPTVRAPLIFSEGLPFLGPDAQGRSALIDTTTSRFDSLFSVDPADRSIFVVQEIDDFTFGELDHLIEPLVVEPIAFEVSMESLSNQEFSGSLQETVGVYESAAASAPGAPVLVESSRVYYPARVGDVLFTPTSALLDLSGSTVEAFEFTGDSGALNRISFVLTNNLSQLLTDGSFAAGSTPAAVLESETGTIRSRVSFDRAPGPGQSALAVVDLASLVVNATDRFRFDVGTTVGLGPISANPLGVTVEANLSITRYGGYTLSDLRSQSGIGSSQSVGLTSTTQFDGFVTTTGSAVATIRNTFPIDITVDQLLIQNATAFDQYPVGHVVSTTGGHFVPALGSTNVLISLGQTAVASSIDVTADASSGGSSSPIRLTADDGLLIDIAAAVDLQRIFITPNGETVRAGSTVGFEADQVRFVDPNDFVELEAGWLDIDNIVNEYDLTLSTVRISFPNILSPPFGAGDSLVLTLTGGLPKQGGGVSQTVDLAGHRIYAGGNSLVYNVSAVSEVATDTRRLDFSERIRGSVTARGLVPRELAATVAAFNVDMNSDVNGDGSLDVLSDFEAEVSGIDELDDLQSLGIDGLQVAGSEISIRIETDIASDFVIYAAVAGVSPSGDVTYLTGIGPNSVDPADTMAVGFAAAGVTLMPAQLIRLEINGASVAGNIERRNVLLDDSNTNVGEFLGALPSEMRFVGRALVQPEGGPVHLIDPFVLETGLAISIPLAVEESFTVSRTFSADLSSLDDVTDPSSRFDISVADVNLDYENGIPLGMSARFEFLDDMGAVTLVLPAATEPALDVQPAPADDAGFSTRSSAGTISLPLNNDQVRALASSRDVRMILGVNTGASRLGRVRADDEVAFALSGNFDLNVTVGN